MKSYRGILIWSVPAAFGGALFFVLAQHLEGFPTDIATFMGSEIVRQGGYAAALALPIGWGVHLTVSLSYAALYTALSAGPWTPERRGQRWALGAGAVFVLGWVTTLITAPAIAIAIGILSGTGLPGQLPALNTGFGAPFWNHVGFFGVVFLTAVVLRDVIAGSLRPGTGQGANEAL